MPPTTTTLYYILFADYYDTSFHTISSPRYTPLHQLIVATKGYSSSLPSCWSSVMAEYTVLKTLFVQTPIRIISRLHICITAGRMRRETFSNVLCKEV
jgi:hypothetical protein